MYLKPSYNKERGSAGHGRAAHRREREDVVQRCEAVLGSAGIIKNEINRKSSALVEDISRVKS